MAHITKILERGPSTSLEFFPPKADSVTDDTIVATAGTLRALRRPDFVSITCKPQDTRCTRTLRLAQRLRHALDVEALIHLSCGGKSRDDVAHIVDEAWALGITNFIALRGDPNPGETAFVPHPHGFAHASELVAFLRRRYPMACIGAACYPEGHIEAVSFDEDLRHLKNKVDAGADFLITQMFFDYRDYLTFVSAARGIGISTPIIPGLMPIASLRQIERVRKLCGIRLPSELERELAQAGDDTARIHRIGTTHLVRECRALIAEGAPGLHFYTMNSLDATEPVYRELFNGRYPRHP